MREIDQNTDAFTQWFTASRGFRIFIYIVIFIAGVGFIATSNNYANGLGEEARSNLTRSMMCLTFIPSYMLLNNLLYDRQSLYWSIIAGIAWGIMGDILAIPFWMATAALLLSLLTQFRAMLLWKAVIWSLAAAAYTQVYNVPNYYVFYALLMGLIVIARKIIFVLDDKGHLAGNGTAESEVSYKEYLEKQQRKREQAENESIVSSFRPPADETDMPNPEPRRKPELPPEPKPVPPVSRGYRPPRDELELAVEVITPKAPPVKKVFRPAKDDYPGMLLMLEKGTQLPAALQTELNGVIKNARMILTSMEEDPEDVKPGNAFLSRYMPALESVVTQIQKLSVIESSNNQGTQAMDKCLHALQALRSAFAQQYEQLQENNQLKFNVEMDMLDSLLKTDGFK